jgi:hypothetical protein
MKVQHLAIVRHYKTSYFAAMLPSQVGFVVDSASSHHQLFDYPNTKDIVQW